MRWLTLCVALGLAVATPACFSPDYGNMSFSCGEGGSCPGGYVCKADNRCYRSGGPDGTDPDSAPIDGMVGDDAAQSDGMVNGADGAVADAAAFDAGAADAVVADAGPPPDANCTPVDLLVEGRFDGLATDVTDAWQEDPIQDGVSLIWSGNGNHTADRYVWLGGIEDVEGTDTVDQTINVPAGAGALTVSGYYRVGVDNPADQGEDNGGVEIVSADGTTVLETLSNWTGGTAVTTWTAFEATSASDYGTQTVRLRLRGYLDGDNRLSNFFFDTLTLTYDPCPE